MESTLLQLIVVVPFASAALLWLLGRRIPDAAAGVLANAAVFVPFAAALSLFGSVPADGAVTATIARWIESAGIDAPFALRLDPLSYTWTLVVTGVGFLIHLYSLGYMKGDPGFRRFFLYLNLFVGSMLALVLGDSFLLLFLGWEGVGLCSYLLIGFWFEDMDNARAGQKAFVVNRIGDLGFLVGLMLVLREFGTLSISEVVRSATEAHETGRLLVGDPTITWITLLLFVGAVGKSAQIPLYVWLPDAMAGPTPVSALIHAATMVTAGIYMVARTSALFALAPLSSAVVATVGCLTAFFTATIALRQRDIKKVLAYSTCSQLGYMFLGLGVGAYGAAVFHVVTHAFFKALLFLGAGSVIHALGGEQDIMKMGGLRRHLPKTHATFLVGCLALAGIFPFAGFFSKDKILGAALTTPGLSFLLGLLGLVTALMTAFYTFRLYRLVFTGPERLSDEAKAHLHESPPVMTIPLVVLAAASVAGGVLSLPHFVHFDLLGDYLAPVFRPAHDIAGVHAEHGALTEIALMTVSLVLAILGAGWAWMKYADGPGAEERPAEEGLALLLENKWFVDEIYAVFVVGPMRALSYLTAFLDRYVVDGAVHGLAATADSFGLVFRRLQNGAVHQYALMFLAGAVFLLLALL